MAIAASVFLMNLLCAMVPCDYNNPMPEMPEIHRSNSSQEGGLRGFSSFRNLMFPKDASSYVRPPRFIEGAKRMLEKMKGKEEGVREYPILSTKNGRVKGYSMMVMSGRWIYAFEGIPYADAPFRWKDAEPVQSWTGVRDALSPGPYCLQLHVGKMFRVLGKENCLTLNVYSPKLNGSLPVIVFIHGGSFAFGAGAEFGPSYLLAKDVVLVSMNYRLGVLGFMSTGDGESVGNYGLKDQALALKWVAENVASFGGDPEKVTLMGQSAGAVSVHLHSLNPDSRRFFKRAVMMSGSALNHWGIQDPQTARSWTSKLSKIVLCPSKSGSRRMVNCLRRVDPNWLVGMQMNLFDWIPFPPVLFGPVVESRSSSSSFISETPEVLISEGEGSEVPSIFSMTTQEGYLANYAMNGLMKTGSFINSVQKYLPDYLNYRHLNSPRLFLTDRILEFYLNNTTKPRDAPMTLYGDMGTDRMFGVGIGKAIKMHKGAPTWAALFSFSGKYNMGMNLGVPSVELGAAHTEDLYYLFNSSVYMQGFMQKDKEAELSKIMVNLITNFADKGEPLYTDDKTGESHRIWDPVGVVSNDTSRHDNEIRWLQLDKEVKMIDDPFVQRRNFWESLQLPDMTP